MWKSYPEIESLRARHSSEWRILSRYRVRTLFERTHQFLKVEPVTASEEAERAGIDLSLIEVSLGYSYDKRAEQHQAAFELSLELERAGQTLE
jgi:hypothetical protein